MKRTNEELQDLVDYQKMKRARCLQPPKIKKSDIPVWIACPSYTKAKATVERTMERYNNKVSDLQSRIRDSSETIESLRAAQRKVDPGRGIFVDTKDPAAVAKYNSRLAETKRLGDKIGNEIDKHNDLVEKKDDAVREAEEKLEELNTQALLAIDDDIVAVLDKCSKVAEKLARSQNSEDFLAALEICLIELKVAHFFEDFIEGNAARKDCRDRTANVTASFIELCGSDHVKNALVDVFRRNAFLIQKNRELLKELTATVGMANQGELDSLTGTLEGLLEQKFNTDFQYEGVVDPEELQEVVNKIKRAIAAEKSSISKIREFMESTQGTAAAALDIQKKADAVYGVMKSNVEAMAADIVDPEHFASQMLDESMIDEFYSRELRPAVAGLRSYLSAAVKEEIVDTIATGEDLHCLGKGSEEITKANITRFQLSRDDVDARIKKLQGMINTAEGDIRNADEVPHKNATALRSELSTAYTVSCIPWIGIFLAGGVPGKVGRFEPALRSAVPVYRELGTHLQTKNNTMMKVMFILAGILGLGGIALFFGLGLSSTPAVNIGVPASVGVLYGISGAIFLSVGKKLTSYSQAEQVEDK